jgi:hypothetical protein
MIRQQGHGLKQVADIFDAWVAAFSIKDQVGPSFGQCHITIRGTESQIGATLGVVGKRLVRQQVCTPCPLGKGKDMHAGEKQQLSSFSVPVNPPTGPAPTRCPSPPHLYPPVSETPGSSVRGLPVLFHSSLLLLAFPFTPEPFPEFWSPVQNFQNSQRLSGVPKLHPIPFGLASPHLEASECHGYGYICGFHTGLATGTRLPTHQKPVPIPVIAI